MTQEIEKLKPEKPPRTRSKHERKRQLIDATITSIAKHGIPGTTVPTVTKIAGLSLGIVNFHFESKQKLFEETLLFLATEHQESWRASFEGKSMTPEKKLLAIVNAHYLPKVNSRKKVAAWFAFYGDSGIRASYRRIVKDIDAARFECLSGIVTDIKAAGDFPNANVRDVTTTLEALFDGLALGMLIYPDTATSDDAKRQIQSYLASVFPGRFSHPEHHT